MPSTLRRSLPITGAAVLLTAALALAEPSASAAPRVRPETADAQALVDELTERSAIARSLLDELDQSDVVVYIRHRVFTSTRLDGRIGFVHLAAPSRYLIIELACGRLRIEQLVTLGHELQHAVEIARAPAVVDPHTLSAHFGRIGMRTSGAVAAWQTFETQAAIDVSMDVRRELIGSGVRTTHDRR